jgi:hypothetical protein
MIDVMDYISNTSILSSILFIVFIIFYNLYDVSPKVHYGKENYLKEFKVVSLANISENHFKFIQEGEFTITHHNFVMSKVKKSIFKYFGKYLSTFSRSRSQTSHGILYIGINDDGSPSGIPVLKNMCLTIDVVEEWIKEYIQLNLIQCVDNNGEIYPDILLFYLRQIKISIATVKSTPVTEDVDTIINDINRAQDAYDIDYNIYLQQKKQWKHINKKYIISLEALANNKQLKNEIHEYFISAKTHIGLYPSKKIINKLLSDTPIIISPGVRDKKRSPKNFEYWITEFKESKKIQRPYHPHKPNTITRNIMKCLTSPIIMKKKFNDNVIYQIIAIHFPTNIYLNRWIEYKKSIKSTDWISCRRSFNPTDGPYCHIC